MSLTFSFQWTVSKISFTNTLKMPIHELCTPLVFNTFQCCAQENTASCHIAPRGCAVAAARLLFAARSWSVFFLLVTPLYGCQWFRRDDFSRASITPHSPIRRGKREMREVRRLAGVVTIPPCFVLPCAPV